MSSTHFQQAMQFDQSCQLSHFQVNKTLTLIIICMEIEVIIQSELHNLNKVPARIATCMVSMSLCFISEVSIQSHSMLVVGSIVLNIILKITSLSFAKDFTTRLT